MITLRTGWPGGHLSLHGKADGDDKNYTTRRQIDAVVGDVADNVYDDEVDESEWQILFTETAV